MSMKDERLLRLETNEHTDQWQPVAIEGIGAVYVIVQNESVIPMLNHACRPGWRFAKVM